ncbi:hypothetical protein LTS18_010490 [Coniosporium uncinatum]|uniref:Uncharacterized protein n=1 Tax=Coniosporium uncinatum TaxID=93489 RepID=A0ACC3DWI4_9PEZI|nr:hypothetical protein LTS18_010490 [Coniosporium uncinatum]
MASYKVIKQGKYPRVQASDVCAVQSRDGKARFVTCDCKIAHDAVQYYERFDQMFEKDENGLRRCRFLKADSSVCDRTFKSPGDMARHEVTHRNNAQFGCSQCDKRFKQQSHLNDHIMGVHGEDGNCSCPYCHRQFNNPRRRADHFAKTPACKAQQDKIQRGPRKVVKRKRDVQDPASRNAVAQDAASSSDVVNEGQLQYTASAEYLELQTPSDAAPSQALVDGGDVGFPPAPPSRQLLASFSGANCGFLGYLFQPNDSILTPSPDVSAYPQPPSDGLGGYLQTSGLYFQFFPVQYNEVATQQTLLEGIGMAQTTVMLAAPQPSAFEASNVGEQDLGTDVFFEAGYRGIPLGSF